MLYQKYIKRTVDIIISCLTIVALLPLFSIVAILIKLNSKGEVFFKQNRVGKNKKIFKMYKFRTMLRFEDSYYKNGSPIENYDRITKVGVMLRKTSIDELPQLINIFIGHMSMVGPRPTLRYQVEKYDLNQVRRLEIRPGLTGLAQINGRNSLNWEKKIQYDLEYLDNVNFITDLVILCKTILVVLKSDDVEFDQYDNISKHAGDIRSDVENIDKSCVDK